MTEQELRKLYLATVEEVARSDFAKKRGVDISPMPYHLDELAAITAKLPAGGRFLDIGTGAGVIPQTILRLGHSVATIEPAHHESGREAIQRMIDLGAEGHLATVGPEPIPLPDASVDVAFAGDVIEHLPGTPRFFLREIARVLRPGGHVVLTTPNAVRLTVRIRVGLGNSGWPPVSQYLDNPAEPGHHSGHHHEYTADELAFVLRDSGFAQPDVRFIEDNLKRSGMLRSMSDIRMQNRSGAGYWSSRRASSFLNPYELVRLGLLGLTALRPGLRSTLIATARKNGPPEP